MSDGGAQRLWFGPFFEDGDDMYRGVKVLVTEVGTTNAKTYWTDEDKTTAVNSGVLTDADGDGIATAFFDGDYRFRVTTSADAALDNPIDWDSTKVTSDTATMWEGNFGTSFPSASADNKWQLFLKHNATDTLAELGVNNGSAFFVIANTSTGTLNEIISAIGATESTVIVKDTQTLTANLTIPANVSLVIEQGGAIAKASTYTLTIDGDLQAGRYKIFNGFSAGDVTFGNTSIPEIFPEWWTTNTTPGTTDMTTAVQSALDAVKGPPTTGIVKLAYTYYAITTLIMYEASAIIGSGWMFDANDVFGSGAWTASNYFGTYMIASGASDAITFDATTPSFTKPQLKDLAIVGPGSGTTVGINAHVAGGGLNNVHDFLNNVLIGNFFSGFESGAFVTGSMRDIVIKGNVTGMTLGASGSTMTDTKIYNADIQQNTTGIKYVECVMTNFYGLLVQSNTTGIQYSPASSGSIGNNMIQGMWVEANTTFIASTGVITLLETTFINVRGSQSDTWTIASGERILRNTFIDFHVAGWTIALGSVDTTAGFFGNNFMGGDIKITGLDSATATYVSSNSFVNFRDATSGFNINLIPETQNFLGTISANPTPDWSDGSMVSLTFDDNITIQAPTNMPNDATINFIITQNGAKTVDFHADYSANWTNTGNNGEINTVMFKKVAGVLWQIGAERGWS